MAALKPQVQPTVLVCNEVSHLSYGSDAANVLCHVVDARSVQRRSMLFITHKPLKHWGAARHDNDLAAAIIDRVLERGRIVALQGLSMRTRHIEDSDHDLCPPSPREARSASDRLGNLTRIPPDPPTHTARPAKLPRPTRRSDTLGTPRSGRSAPSAARSQCVSFSMAIDSVADRFERERLCLSPLAPWPYRHVVPRPEPRTTRTRAPSTLQAVEVDRRPLSEYAEITGEVS